MIVELNEDNFEKEAMQGLKVIEFYTTWCGYCRNQRIELENFENSPIWIGIVDAEESPNLARRFEIKGYPTFIILKNGVKVGEFSGLHDKSQLLAKLMSYIDTDKFS